MSTPRSIERLANTLVGLERRVRMVEVQPQLGYSSITDGAINVYKPRPLPDGVGTTEGAAEFEEILRSVFGQLPDGSTGQADVNGPPPPQPSAPLLEESPRGAVVRWDGHNGDGTDIQPMDWSRLEIHARPVQSLDSTFEPHPGSLRGTIETPQGGTLTITTGLDWDPDIDRFLCVRFVARNTSGTASVASDPAVVAVGKVESHDLADFSVTVTKFVSLRHFLY